MARYTIGRDGPSYETISEALAVLPWGEQIWMDGQELGLEESKRLAQQEREAYDPEDYP